VAREPRVGEVLPRADEAMIPREKLVDYVLNPDHPRGRHKANAFKLALGIERPNWRYLHDEILAALRQSPVSSSQAAEGPRPASWAVVIPVAGLNGRTVPVITKWQIVEGRPSLISAFVRRRGGQRGLTI
jgi:hypothetical protein